MDGIVWFFVLGALSFEDIRDLLELEKIKTHHWQIVGCSAVTGENLLTGVDWILEAKLITKLNDNKTCS